MMIDHHWHLHRVHLRKHHYIKMVVSFGCVGSTYVALTMPGYATHATLIATATNLFWAWA